MVELRGERQPLCVIVEVQRATDEEKRWAWPLYAWSLAARRRCRVCLLVICDDERVATWAEKPIDFVLNSELRPVVLGPSRVPRVRSFEEAHRHPEVALLSVLAHAEEPGGDAIVEAALRAVHALDGPQRRRYHDWLLVTSDVARRILEELMDKSRYEYPMSDFAREHFGRGFAEGSAKGKAEGKTEGKAEAVLAVLAARGIAVDDGLRQRIEACVEPLRLDRMLSIAVTCREAGELVLALQ